MNHPTEEQLNAWIDGEAEALAAGADTAAHVEQCSRCQQRVEGTRSLGSALRMWADDAAPVAADDLFDKILAEARAADTVSRPSVRAPAPDAQQTTGARVDSTAEKPRETSNVTSLASRRRFSRALVAAPVLLAAAAAAIFAITRPPAGITGAGGDHNIAGQGTTHDNGTRIASAADPGGSSVLSVDVGGQHTSYSVLEVPGSREGATTAVVWIEDSTGGNAGAVQ